VAQAQLRVLLRDFQTGNLPQLLKLLENAALASEREFPGAMIDIQLTPQYRNMAEGLAREPRAVRFAQQAVEQLGRVPRLSIVRGGTDGSRFTELGLPTPNLSTGQHNPHSTLEWACLEEMAQAAEMLVQLLQIWADENVPPSGT
jgi:tripeptide aminopeptidase